MIKQTWQHQTLLSVLVTLLVCSNSYAVKVQESANTADASANQAQTATSKIKSADTRQIASGGENGVGKTSTGGDNGVGELSTGGDNGVGALSTGGDNGVGALSTGGDNGVGEIPTNVRKVPEKTSNPK